MAFGIDDFLTALAAGLNLSDTLVRTIQSYSRKDEPEEIESLIGEVRIAALEDIASAKRALEDFTDLLRGSHVDLDQTLEAAITKTPFLRPFRKFKLARAQRSIDAFKDSVYRSCSDVEALVRCLGRTQPMGSAVVESSAQKREFRERLRAAKSLREMIDILHQQLDAHEAALKR